MPVPGATVTLVGAVWFVLEAVVPTNTVTVAVAGLAVEPALIVEPYPRTTVPDVAFDACNNTLPLLAVSMELLASVSDPVVAIALMLLAVMSFTVNPLPAVTLKLPPAVELSTAAEAAVIVKATLAVPPVLAATVAAFNLLNVKAPVVLEAVMLLPQTSPVAEIAPEPPAVNVSTLVAPPNALVIEILPLEVVVRLSVPADVSAPETVILPDEANCHVLVLPADEAFTVTAPVLLKKTLPLVFAAI